MLRLLSGHPCALLRRALRRRRGHLPLELGGGVVRRLAVDLRRGLARHGGWPGAEPEQVWGAAWGTMDEPKSQCNKIGWKGLFLRCLGGEGPVWV